jgi:anti-sigma regulatory factor (Ser/Thr protein kinase)
MRVPEGSGPSDRSMCWKVADGPAAVAGARRTASGVLRGWGLAALVDETVLMLDELVTNAVRHGNGPIELRLRVDDDAGMLFGEVRDAGAVLPTRCEAAPSVEHGRGLAVITALAASYGRQRIDGGSTAARPSGSPSPSPCRRDPPEPDPGGAGRPFSGDPGAMRG